jgi:2-polyprenyl-6-methoxyphenol hydroxylase-like FAD-dependent oxidoreductase
MMGGMRSAVVVGAGIGGLSAAIGLRRAGWQVRVLERAPEFAPVGAGITLWPNAVRALGALGVDAGARTAGGVGGIRNRGGVWYSRLDWSRLERLAGGRPAALTRARLHRTLLAALGPEHVRLGVDVDEVPEAELVVAADGIDSALRTRLWPATPPPAPIGLTTWRGLAPVPAGGLPPWSNSWHRDQEFGIVPVADDQVYWFAAQPARVGDRAEVARVGDRAELVRRFGHWHDPIPELIASTPAILHLDVRHLPRVPRSFVHGRVVLLGDAAHAMAPNLGQGGGMAIEDAVTLAAALAATPDVDAALSGYDRARRPRTAAVARDAARLARLMLIGNPAFTTARDIAVRLTPGSLALRPIARWARWSPP